MTIETFAEYHNVKDKTVKDWIKKDLIPGANLEKNYIPDSARVPYTEARAKNARAIYVSIVKGSGALKHVLPKLYKICDDEFNGYIDRLEDAKLIQRRVSDGITYYDATIEACKIKEEFILKAVEAAARGFSEGMTNVLYDRKGA